ncbi:MAG: ROK family protein [Verrucomicrobia bacterium]|nr:ROK family protein [Verrucomicrobiota bacterium]
MSSHSSFKPASATSFCAIGVDVGGTKIAAGIVTFPGAGMVARRALPTFPKRGGEPVLADVLRLAKELIEEASELELRVGAIGVGVCELVDLTGQIASANCISWEGIPIQEQLQPLAPTFVEADVRAAALGEAMFGAGHQFKTFIYLTVGTGISSCFVIDGCPFPGARGAAGTIASSPLTAVCERCGNIEHRTLEEIASGPALVTRYNLRAAGRVHSAEEVIAAANAGDPAATAVVRSAGDALGKTVALLVNALDPEAVVVGGGLGSSGGTFWECFEATTRRLIWSDLNRNLPMLTAGLKGDAGLIGAAAAACLKLKSEKASQP